MRREESLIPIAADLFDHLWTDVVTAAKREGKQTNGLTGNTGERGTACGNLVFYVGDRVSAEIDVVNGMIADFNAPAGPILDLVRSQIRKKKGVAAIMC